MKKWTYPKGNTQKQSLIVYSSDCGEKTEPEPIHKYLANIPVSNRCIAWSSAKSFALFCLTATSIFLTITRVFPSVQLTICLFILVLKCDWSEWLLIHRTDWNIIIKLTIKQCSKGFNRLNYMFKNKKMQ